MNTINALVRDGLVIVGADGAVRESNTAATTITGFSTPAELGTLLDCPAGLLEVRPAKWIELRHSDVTWDGEACRAAVFTDVTAQIALRESERRLRDIGLVDPVTGLATLPIFHDHLTRSLALAERDRRWTGVLWFGMRRFTRPTDDGRALADEVLRQTAQRLRTAIRDSDLAARVENDAFAVTLTAMTTPADARIVAVRVLLTLSSPVFVEGRDRSVRVTAGVVSACDHSIDPKTLIVRARRAAVQGVELDEPLVVSAA